MRIDPHVYERFAAALREEFGEDDQLIADMLEGETDLHEVVSVLLRAEMEAKAFAGANKALSEEYAARRKQMEDRSQHLRDKMLALMQATGQRKIVHALGTLSLRPTSASVVFDGDAAELPEELRNVAITANKVALRSALEAGTVIPGARLTNGGEAISIRRK